MTTFEIVIITALALFILLYIVGLFITAPTYECSRTDKGKSCLMDCEGCRDFKQMYATPERAIACYKLRIEIVEEIQKQIRDLRDSDKNPCHSNEDGECTCHYYNQMIDELDKLKEL